MDLRSPFRDSDESGLTHSLHERKRNGIKEISRTGQIGSVGARRRSIGPFGASLGARGRRPGSRLPTRPLGTGRAQGGDPRRRGGLSGVGLRARRRPARARGARRDRHPSGVRRGGRCRRRPRRGSHRPGSDPCARARRLRALRPRADLERRRRARGAAGPAGPAARRGEGLRAVRRARRGGGGDEGRAARRSRAEQERAPRRASRARARGPAAVVSGLQEPPRGAHAVALRRGEGRSAPRLRAPVPARQARPQSRGRRGGHAVPSLLRAGRSRGLRRLDRCGEAARQAPLEAGRGRPQPRSTSGSARPGR